MYETYLLRIHNSFKKSAYSYSTITLLTMGIVSFIWSLTLMIIAEMFAVSDYNPVGSEGKYKICHMSWPVWV